MNPPALDVVWLGEMEYRAAWELQKDIAEKRRRHECNDTLLLLEHPPVYTLGRETQREHWSAGEPYLRSLGADVVDVDRGGSVTFHGPGQLVAYPIVELASLLPIPSEPGRGDVLRYLRALEDALMEVTASYGIQARQRAPLTGVWVDEGKLAAIGVKLGGGGITLHGIALNISTDLKWFAEVIPCGIRNEDVASFEKLGVTGVTTREAGSRFGGALARHLGFTVAIKDGLEAVR